ncbi:MAG: phosphoribosyl-AMP cyclohydrolase [Planctomycetaceae bacterium]|nr:phosphoribosyl-AMP cyclohydrolase [Planctomycetaceae bacterium]
MEAPHERSTRFPCRSPKPSSFESLIGRLAPAERSWYAVALKSKNNVTRQGVQVPGPDFSKAELLPVIAQDEASGVVLMLAYMNEESYRETLAPGRVCYYSRSRQKLWRKGEESGNVQEVREIYFDCDADTLLIKVNQIGGAACHEGYQSCFFRRVDPGTGDVTTVGERVFDPADVYKKS